MLIRFIILRRTHGTNRTGQAPLPRVPLHSHREPYLLILHLLQLCARLSKKDTWMLPRSSQSIRSPQRSPGRIVRGNIHLKNRWYRTLRNPTPLQ